MSTIRGRARSAAVGVLVAALLATGCSGGDEPDPPASTETPEVPATPAPPLATTTTVAQVAGSRLPRERRRALVRQVTRVVDGWIDGAYVGGTWPRAGVAGAFADFSPGAKRQARRNLKVLSNVDIGARVTAVTAKRRDLALDVLAVKRRPVAVTARLVLRFATEGRAARTETVRARLFLTRGGQGWQVFGYDVSAGDRTVRGTGRNG